MIKALVLSAKGIECFAELGALYAIDDSKMIDNVRSYTGVSNGAITALLLAAGYTVTEIFSMAVIQNLYPIPSDMASVALLSKTYPTNEQLKQILTDALVAKYHRVHTFASFYQVTGRELTIVAYNITHRRTEYFSRQTMPDMSVIDAVLCSCTVPFLYSMQYRYCVYIDGSYGDPYPKPPIPEALSFRIVDDSRLSDIPPLVAIEALRSLMADEIYSRQNAFSKGVIPIYCHNMFGATSIVHGASVFLQAVRSAKEHIKQNYE